MKHNPLFLLSSGAFLVGLSFAWAFYAPHTLASGQLQPFVQTHTDNQICPLSVSQQERARQAWTELDRMLRSDPPRCINCHGRMNPFVDGTKHPGGKLTFLHDKKGRRDFLATKQTQCLFCHEAPWQAPVGKDLWHFQNTVQLCTHIRKEFDTSGALQSHLQSDPLADLAFEGKRALNDVGQAIYEGEFGRPPVPEPPSFTRGKLTMLAELWTDAMGGEFKGGESCGCEPHRYSFKGSFDEVWAEGEGAGHLTGHGELQIPIQFNDDGSFSGETAIDVNETNTWTLSVMSCIDSIVYSGVRWKINGTVDGTGATQVTFTVQFPPTEMKTVCTAMDVTTNNSDPNIRPEQIMDFSDFLTVGQTFKVEQKYNEVGGFLQAQFTIVEEGK